jgi:hypothetical protein
VYNVENRQRSFRNQSLECSNRQHFCTPTAAGSTAWAPLVRSNYRRKRLDFTGTSDPNMERKLGVRLLAPYAHGFYWPLEVYDLDCFCPRKMLKFEIKEPDNSSTILSLLLYNYRYGTFQSRVLELCKRQVLSSGLTAMHCSGPLLHRS